MTLQPSLRFLIQLLEFPFLNKIWDMCPASVQIIVSLSKRFASVLVLTLLPSDQRSFFRWISKGLASSEESRHARHALQYHFVAHRESDIADFGKL